MKKYPRRQKRLGTNSLTKRNSLVLKITRYNIKEMIDMHPTMNSFPENIITFVVLYVVLSFSEFLDNKRILLLLASQKFRPKTIDMTKAVLLPIIHGTSVLR